MTKLLGKTKAVRKTFTIPLFLVEELENYAKQQHQKQSQVVACAIETYVLNKQHSNKVQQRVQSLENLIGIAPKGSLRNLDKKDLKEIKASKNA